MFEIFVFVFFFRTAAREDICEYVGRCAHLQRSIWRCVGHRCMELSATVDIVAGGGGNCGRKLCGDKAERSGTGQCEIHRRFYTEILGQRMFDLTDKA